MFKICSELILTEQMVIHAGLMTEERAVDVMLETISHKEKRGILDKFINYISEV